jgi:hypothetical protein
MARLPNEKHLIELTDSAIRTLKTVLPDLGELRRRREHDAADGYPSQSMGEGGAQGTISDPTARAAGTKPPSDPTGDYIDTIFRLLQEIDERARLIHSCHTQVFVTGESERGRQSSVRTCAFGCIPITEGQVDRLWMGYCRKHYDQWLAWSRKRANDGLDPSPVIFRKAVEQEITEAQSKRGKQRQPAPVT